MNAAIANLPTEFTPATGAAHGKVTVADAVLTVGPATLALAEQTRYLEIQIQKAPTWHTVNSTDPAAVGEVGFRLEAGTIIRMSRTEWLASKWIREGATSAVLQIKQLARP